MNPYDPIYDLPPTPPTPEVLTDTASFSFLGMPSQQMFVDLVLWEYFFRKNDFNHLIELGSGYGGFSIFLLLQCISHAVKFTTYDTRTPKAITSRIGRELKLQKHFVNLDILISPKEIIEAAHHPLVLFCDNGNKPREVAIYSPLLDPGDFLAVHDWNLEIKLPQIPTRLKYLPIENRFAESLDSITRFFQVQ